MCACVPSVLTKSQDRVNGMRGGKRKLKEWSLFYFHKRMCGCAQFVLKKITKLKLFSSRKLAFMYLIISFIEKYF